MNKMYEESSIQAIANAIRSKNGSSDTYTVSQMSTAIENIPSGSSTALQGLPLNNQKNNVIINTLEDNTSVNNPFNGAVDWGDGTTDSSSTHTYTKAGYYTISSSQNIANSASKQITEAEIITTFGSYSTAFQNNTILNKAIVSGLKENLFEGCTGLKKLTVIDSVTNIPNSCFKSVDMDCWSIPNTITNIGVSAFQSAKNIVFPNNTITATIINNYAFRYANFKNKILIIGAGVGNYAFDSTNLEVVKFTNLSYPFYSNSILTNNKLYEVMFNSTVGSEILSNPIIPVSTDVYRNIHFTSTSPNSQWNTDTFNLSSKDTVYCPVGYLSNYQTAFNTILNGATLLEEPANGITFSYDYYNTSWFAGFAINGYITNNSNEDKAITSISFNYGDAVLDNSTATLSIGGSYPPIVGVYDTTNHTITFTVNETLTTAELSKAFNITITPTSSSGGSYTVPKNAFTCTAGLVWIIPEGTTTVGTNYQGNTNLVKVVIPNSVTSIGHNAFNSCSSLASINLSNVQEIVPGAFRGCTSLSGHLDISNATLTGYSDSSDNGAFMECTGITSVTIGAVEPYNSSKRNAAFKNCTGLTTATILGGTSTGRATFNDCSALRTVYLPDTITEIGNYSFQGCSNLTLYVRAITPPTILQFSFYSSNITAIYVPAESVETYKAASGWSNYASIIQAEPTAGE